VKKTPYGVFFIGGLFLRTGHRGTYVRRHKHHGGHFLPFYRLDVITVVPTSEDMKTAVPTSTPKRRCDHHGNHFKFL